MKQDTTSLEKDAPNPRLVIVAAIARNGVIGRDNALPWRLETDLSRLRRLTWGKPMIMGRRSWDSIGRPLPGRDSIVLTHQPNFHAAGAFVAHSWEEALRLGAERAAVLGSDEIVAFGGADIFAAALPLARTLHLTIVEADPPGDVRFPAYDAQTFVEVFREPHETSERDEFAFTFVDLARREFA